MNRALRPTEPIPEVYQAIGAYLRGEPFKQLEAAVVADRAIVKPRRSLRSRLTRALILLGGGGPMVLIFADRIAHACGFCLGF